MVVELIVPPAKLRHMGCINSHPLKLFYTKPLKLSCHTSIAKLRVAMEKGHHIGHAHQLLRLLGTKGHPPLHSGTICKNQRIQHNFPLPVPLRKGGDKE